MRGVKTGAKVAMLSSRKNLTNYGAVQRFIIDMFSQWNLMTNDIYRATMRFLSRVSTEMNDQHVLGLEWLLLTSTILPLAHKALLIGAHMVIIQVLE